MQTLTDPGLKLFQVCVQLGQRLATDQLELKKERILLLVQLVHQHEHVSTTRIVHFDERAVPVRFHILAEIIQMHTGLQLLAQKVTLDHQMSGM